MNELVHIDQTNNAIALPADLTGMGNIKIKPTNIKLVQPTTQDPGAARPGQFLDELSGEAYDAITMVLLRVTFPRTKYPAGAGFGDDPECRSNDGVTPSPFSKVVQAKTCASCRHSKWFNGVRPPCKEAIRMLFINKDTELPRIFQATGMGLRPTQNMLEQLKQDCVTKYKKTGVQPNLFDYYFTMTSDKNQNKQGVFYTPRYKDFKQVANPGQFGPHFAEYVTDYFAAAKASHEVEEDEAVTNAVAEVIDAEIVEV